MPVYAMRSLTPDLFTHDQMTNIEDKVLLSEGPGDGLKKGRRNLFLSNVASGVILDSWNQFI